MEAFLMFLLALLFMAYRSKINGNDQEYIEKMKLIEEKEKSLNEDYKKRLEDMNKKIQQTAIYLKNRENQYVKKYIENKEELEAEREKLNNDFQNNKNKLEEKFNEQKKLLEKYYADKRNQLIEQFTKKYKMDKEELSKSIELYNRKCLQLDKDYKEKENVLKNRKAEINNSAMKLKEQFEIEYKEIEKIRKEINDNKIELKIQKNALEKDKELLKLKVKDIPVLAKYFTDREESYYDNIEDYLLNKPRPALTSAEIVRELKHEKKIIISKLKTAEYLTLYYESLVPWLKELEEEPLDINSIDKNYFNYYESKKDAVTYWLTPTEYANLSETERNQLALERYNKRQKSNAEIGRDFERYIGYLYEQENFQVEYRGIIDGFEDRGRDLICRNNKQTLVIQCKYWSKNKTIHENHINQLFGTTVKYYMEVNPDTTFLDFYNALKNKMIVPVFITSTTLSETAKAFADTLGILVKENEKIGDYPMIKCNINSGTKEKIYHLPFDQQYDKVKIGSKDEFYSMTVEEAEKAGFRRAKKWLGN